jgi:hypothetical protein
MRPARILTAVVFAAAVAVTGCAAHPTAAPPAAPVTPAAAPPVTPTPKPPSQPPDHTPKVAIDRVPPVLADGHYDSYIRTVDRSHNRLVVDLVQVFHDQAAVDAAIADGKPREAAQVLYTYIRNQNPRLRTLPLASDLHLDLLAGDCEAPVSKQLSTLAAHARSGGSYFTLTVAAGAVQQIKEQQSSPAC